MIGDVLSLLRDQLDSFLRAAAPAADEGTGDPRVQLLDGAKSDPIEFRLNAITLLLVNIEQETGLRSADPYLRLPGDAGLRQLLPEIQLNLRLLAVARFKVYEQGLNQLGLVIRFLQRHRAIEPGNTPGWPQQLDRLVLELVTLPQGEQNEIWSALRVSYQPSALFRVRLVVFRDADGTAVPQIAQTRVQVVRKP